MPESIPAGADPTTASPHASRRGFLSTSARLLGGGAAAVALAGTPLAGGAQVAAQPAPSDLDILNYALTLEHLEATFYTQGLQRFNRGAFQFTKALRGFGGQIKSQFYENLVLIRDHEVTHVETLTAVIQSLGGTPVGPACYNFGYHTVEQFLAIAEALEDTGVMAYAGALALIQSPELQTAGATIATVEARHAAYLRLLNGHVPFPTAFDTPKTMAEILAIAGQFIVPC